MHRLAPHLCGNWSRGALPARLFAAAARPLLWSGASRSHHCGLRICRETKAEHLFRFCDLQRQLRLEFGLLRPLLTNQAGNAAITAWAWRVPFFLGGTLAFANFFIRKHLHETPEFSNLQSKRERVSVKEPFLCLIRDYRKELFLGVGVTGFMASMVIFALYMPTYISTYFSYPTADVYFAMMWGLLWSVIVLPCSGLVVDRVGRAKVFVTTCLMFALLAIPLFSLLKLGGLAVLIIFMMLYQTVISFIMTSYFALLAETFPTPVRYTGIALCYNVAYSLMGCAPMVITGLIEWTRFPSLGVWFLIGFALLSARNVTLLTKRRSQITGGFSS